MSCAVAVMARSVPENATQMHKPQGYFQDGERYMLPGEFHCTRGIPGAHESNDDGRRIRRRRIGMP